MKVNIKLKLILYGQDGGGVEAQVKRLRPDKQGIFSEAEES
jgi:hypothetical protein